MGHNTFDAGADGANLTIATSGGGNGDAFSYLIIENASTPGGGTAIRYEADAAVVGDMGCRITPTGTNGTYVRKDVTSGTRSVIYGWFRVPSLPTGADAVNTLFHLRGTSGMASVVMSSTGQIKVLNAASVALAGSVYSGAEDEWYFGAMAVSYGTTTSNGRIELRIWDSTGTLVKDYDSGATTNVGTVAVQQYRYGNFGTGSGWPYVDYDEVGWLENSASGWPTVPLPASNTTPTADAGADLSGIEPFATVTLDGTDSTDSDGTITGYSWAQTAGTPTVILTGAATATPTFEAPATISGTTLTFTLTVTDDDGTTDTDTVQVGVLPHTWFQIEAGGTLSPIRASIIT